MLKRCQKDLIVTSVVTLLPILWGLLLWNKLPEAIIIHWNALGQADRTGSRSFVVFGMPLVLLAFQWLSIFATAADPKNQNQNRKPLRLMLWVVPVLSNLVIGMMYTASMGGNISPVSTILVFIGLLFAAIGNYLPKCKPNSTMGLRFCWTLASDANWTATHRFAGKVWVIGGIVMVCLALLPPYVSAVAMLVDTILLIALPLGFSYRCHRKEAAADK